MKSLDRCLAYTKYSLNLSHHQFIVIVIPPPSAHLPRILKTAREGGRDGRRKEERKRQERGKKEGRGKLRVSRGQGSRQAGKYVGPCLKGMLASKGPKQ